MKRRLTFEFGFQSQEFSTKGKKKSISKVYAALIKSKKDKKRAKKNPKGSANAGQTVQHSNGETIRSFRNILMIVLLIGICIVIVAPLTNTIQWIAHTKFAQCIGIQYSQDQISLLNNQILDLILEIANTILWFAFALGRKVRGN